MTLGARYATWAEAEADRPFIYLSGVVTPGMTDAGAERYDIGPLLTPDIGNAPELAAAPWAADNGCFTKPERYSDERFLAWLAKKGEGGNAGCCLFANAPDVVHWSGGAPKVGYPIGDPVATLERSRPMFAKIRELGYPAALVCSAGIEGLVPWDELDAIFLGGDDTWKLGPEAAALTAEARARGTWVHMGRVNSLKRLRYAKAIGCDSADGTFVNFHRTENTYRLVGWLDEINRGELSLPLRWYKRPARSRAGRASPPTATRAPLAPLGA